MLHIAHTKNSQGNQQGLIEHLVQVAELASMLAMPLGPERIVP